MKIKRVRIRTRRGIITVTVDSVTGKVTETNNYGGANIIQRIHRIGPAGVGRRNQVQSFFIDWDYCQKHRKKFPKGSSCPACP